MMMPDVEVRKCKGAPHHFVTEDGRVWSAAKGRFLVASPITPLPDCPEYQYFRVNLRGKTRYIHKLVGEVWGESAEARLRDSKTGRFTRQV